MVMPQKKRPVHRPRPQVRRLADMVRSSAGGGLGSSVAAAAGRCELLARPRAGDRELRDEAGIIPRDDGWSQVCSDVWYPSSCFAT